VHAWAPAHEALRREISPNVYRTAEFGAKLAEGEPFLQRVIEDRKDLLPVLGYPKAFAPTRPYPFAIRAI
jgi:hypothetical protein